MKKTVKLGDIKQGLAGAEQFNKDKRPIDMAFAMSDFAAALRVKVKTAEDVRIEQILDKYVKRDPADVDKPLAEQRKLYVKDAEQRDTPIPDFVDGGRAAYQKELDALDDTDVELEFTPLDRSKVSNLKNEAGKPVHLEPWVLEALRPFFAAAPTVAAKVPVATPPAA